MSATLTALPTRDDVLARRVRLSVDEYEDLGRLGILKENEKLELLDGWVKEKGMGEPIHDGTVRRLDRALLRVFPPDWDTRCQLALRLPASVPLPDNLIVRADIDDYTTRHPSALEAGLVAEVAHTTLDQDREEKLPIYAAARIPVYWIVNVVHGCIEVYTDPVADTYTDHHDYLPGQSVPLFLDGVHVADIPVSTILV